MTNKEQDMAIELDELFDTPEMFANLLSDASSDATAASNVQPKAIPKGVIVKEDVGSEDKKGKKERSSNAERCRRHRERKREKEQQVILENAALKRERKEMLEQITELEYQEQTLRGQGYMDLSAENDLLRQEIKKHRQYIEQVVNLADNGSLDTTEEERNRILTSCVESTISQMVGLSYNSLVNPTWVEGVSMSLVLDEETPIQCHTDIRYQCLPLGSTPSNALRINLRFDIAKFPFSGDIFSRYLKKMGTDVNKLRNQYKGIELPYELAIEELFPCREIGESFFSCFRYLQTFLDSKLETIIVFSSKEVAVYPEAFLDSIQGVDTDENGRIHVKIHSSTSCNLLKPKETTEEDEVQRKDDLVSNTLIVIDEGPNSCHLVSLGTVRAEHFSRCFPVPPISEDGKLGEEYLKQTKVTWQRIFKGCCELSELRDKEA